MPTYSLVIIIVIASIMLFFIGGSIAQRIVSKNVFGKRADGSLSIYYALPSDYPNLDVKMTSMNDNLMVKGTVSSPEMAEDVISIVKRFVDEAKIINKLSIETATQVMLKVKIAEVKRSVTKSMGINWRAMSSPGGNSAGLIGMVAGSTTEAFPKSTNDPLTGVLDTVLTQKSISGGKWFVSAGINNISALIDAAATESLATILAEPNLVALSGKEAKFKSGGQKGYSVVTSNSANTEFKDWGTILEFTPVVLSEDRINVKVKAEVSSVDAQEDKSAAPSLSTKNVETVVELGSGQSIVLAGLLQKERTISSNETPFLADIPLIGSLFKNSNPSLSETELVIIVTPYIVKPSSKKLKTPVDMIPKLLSPFKAITRRSFTSTNSNKADSAGFSIK